MSDYSEVKRLVEQGSLPPIVATLISENECIKTRLCVCRDCGGQGEIYSGHDSYQGYNQPPEPDMEVCGTCGGEGVLGPLEDFESLAAERDQLKAEVAGLKTGYEAYEQTVKELRAEVEALREDAERYRWLQHGHSGYIEVVEWIGPHATGMTGEDLDALVDAAMGKGEQS